MRSEKDNPSLLTNLIGNMNLEAWVILLVCIEFTAARQCCPENTWLLPKSRNCSDYVTPYDLQCPEGSFLLNPNNNSYDNFVEVMDGLWFGDQFISADRYCISRIWTSEYNVSAKKVALLCFPTPEFDINVVFVSLMVISVIFLFLTIIVYVIVPTLRDLPGQCVIAFTSSLALGYTFLIITHFRFVISNAACVVQANLTYFFLISAFFWLNAITFNVWRTVTWKQPAVKENKWFFIFVCWGYGLPAFLVLLSVILEHLPGDHIKPEMGELRCWFSGPVQTWSFFYGPVALLLFINFIMYISTACILWTNYSDSAGSTSQKSSALKFMCKLYLKLFLLMGINWIFEIVSFATSRLDNKPLAYFWLITDCFNCLQGVVIFLILVLFREKARAGVAKYRVCGIRWPQTWIEDRNIESDTVLIQEEVELSQPK